MNVSNTPVGCNLNYWTFSCEEFLVLKIYHGFANIFTFTYISTFLAEKLKSLLFNVFGNLFYTDVKNMIAIQLTHLLHNTFFKTN